MSLSQSTFNSLLKEYILKHKVPNVSLKADPFYTMVKKDPSWLGQNTLRVGIQYANPQNVSSDATTAFAGTGNSSQLAFTVTRARKYSKAQIDRELLLSSTDEYSLLKAADAQLKGAAESAARALSIELFRDGTGALGQISSISTNTVTLTTASDALNFEIGMVCTSYATATTSTSTDGNSLTVTGVNVTSGTVIFSANTGLDASDYLFRTGDKGGVALTGLAGWIPATAPSASENFNGQDRSVAPERLAGSRLTASTGTSLEEAAIEIAAQIGRMGGSTDTFILSFDKWSAFQKLLTGRVIIQEHKVGEVGFDAIMINVPGGRAKVMASNACPSNRMYALNMDTWKLATLGDTIGKVDEDVALLRGTGDNFEIRYATYGNLICTNPSSNGVVLL